LRKIRNAASAHREHDALAQLRAIEELDVDSVLDIAKEFGEKLRIFNCIMTEIHHEFTLPNMFRGRVNLSLIAERVTKG